MINRQGKEATMAWPIATVMADIFDKMGWMQNVLGVVAWLVLLVASFLIFTSIYSAMNERRREFAILRALGASRFVVFSAIQLEAVIMALLGCLVGYMVNSLILSCAAYIIKAQVGVVLSVWQYHDAYLFVPLGMLVLGMIVGLIPALRAYKLEVASSLVAHS
ncbi:MAG: FtsX-like permease family protein [Candidatus Cloacimonetes bacterium]|nr:FtsX-like permease family protein [Candidatus Cloacimonadota bacterium]